MTKQQFNLVVEPWIPVRFEDGEIAEVSLAELFERGKDVQEICAEVATMSAALLRLSLAITYAAYRESFPDGSPGLFSQDDWEDAWDDPDILIERVATYLKEYEERFWLFHPQRPFMQVAGLRTAKDSVDSIAKIIADVPDGHRFMTLRDSEGESRISCAEAARWLVHVHAWDTSGIKSGAVGDPRVKGGRGYPIGTGWVGQLGFVFIEGKNFIETLLRNLIPYDAYAELGIPLNYPSPHEDLPPWEREADTERQRGSDTVEPEPAGVIELYTWQSRRVRLVAEGNEVTGVVLAQGDKITPQNRNLVEPMSLWRYSGPQTKKFGYDIYMPKMHDPSRALWRGLNSLLVGMSETVKGKTGQEVPQYLPAAVLAWNSMLVYDGHISLSEYTPVRAIGIEYGPQSSSFANLYDDRLVLPGVLLSEKQRERRALVKGALAVTDEIVSALARFAGDIVKASAQQVDPETVKTAGARERELCYFMLDRLFRQWLLNLDGEMDKQRAFWRGELERMVWERKAMLSKGASQRAFIGNETMSLGSALFFLERTVNQALSGFSAKKEKADG